MEEVGDAAQLRAGELIIIVVVLVMWAGNIYVQRCTFVITDLVGIHCLWANVPVKRNSGCGIIPL